MLVLIALKDILLNLLYEWLIPGVVLEENH